MYDAKAYGVVVRDAGGTVVFANTAAHRIFGRPPGQLIGISSTGEVRRLRADGTPMPDDEVPNVAAQRRGEPIRDVVMGLAGADGYVRWLLIDAVPIKNPDGTVRQVVSSFSDVTDARSLAEDLRRGLDRRELTLAYQPIVDLRSRVVSRVEALSRWAHPTRGQIAPREFVAAAGRSGLARPFLEYVLRASLAQCRRWRDLGLSLEVSINLAASDLADEELVRIVSRHLAEARVDPAWVAVEVSEATVTADPVGTVSALEGLVELGVHLAIDDLGVGSTSLGFLERLPAHAVKIDGSVVGRLTRDTNKQSIAALVIDLGQTLGLDVIAEGIEDKATLRALDALHCTWGQGFFLARPMIPDAIVAWLSRSSTSSSSA